MREQHNTPDSIVTARPTKHLGFVPAFLLALITLQGGFASAQTLEHYYYTGSGSIITNDQVGSATGSINGSATLSSGALVTDGTGGGLVSGVPTNSMHLDASAVSGVTNEFTISIWYQAAGNAYQSHVFDFSDGTSANMLACLAVDGGNPYPPHAYTGIGGSYTDVWGDGFDNGNGGSWTDDGDLHNLVLIYSGANLTMYVDNQLAGSASLSGFNLSSLTTIGVAGGSPWGAGDRSFNGTTYSFAIIKGSISPGQVLNLYSAGEFATVADIADALAAPSSVVWDGGSLSDDNWSSAANWAGDTPPGTSGSAITFAGSTRTSPVMEQNYTIPSLTFSNDASSFSLNQSGGSTLTLAGDLINESSNSHTINLPIQVATSSAWDGGGYDLDVNEPLSGSGGISWLGGGTLTLDPGANALGGQLRVARGALNISGGSVTAGGELSAGHNTAGVTGSGSGTVKISDATVSAGKITVAASDNLANTVSGTMTVTNSTVTANEDVILGYVGGGTADLILENNSVFNVGGVNGTKWAYLGWYDSVSATVDIEAGATMNINNDGTIRMARDNNVGTNTLNVNGDLTFYGGNGSGPGTNSILDLHFGTWDAVNTVNLNTGGTLAVSEIVSTWWLGTRVFNFNGGTLKAAYDGRMHIGNDTNAFANILASPAIIDTDGYSFEVQQPLKNGTGGADGGLTKLGDGPLTLSGSNTFNGPITVSAGELLLTPAHQGNNAVSVANGATFGAIEGSAATVGDVTLGNSVLRIVLPSGMNPSAAVLNVGALTANSTATLKLSGVVQTGTFTVVHADSHGGAGSVTNVVGPQGFEGFAFWETNDLKVTCTAAGGSLVWSGADLQEWNVGFSDDWTVNGSPTTYQEDPPVGNAVTFNDSALGGSLVPVDIFDVVEPMSVTINNSTKNYVFSDAGGRISGSTGLAKQGTGSVILDGQHDYTGDTIISDGTLKLGAANCLPGGDGKGDLVVNGTLDLNGFDGTYNNLSGGGTVTNTLSDSTYVGRFYVNSTADSTFSGVMSGGPVGSGRRFSIHKQSGSPDATLTLDLTGTCYFENLLLEVGQLKLTGGKIVADSGSTYTVVRGSAGLEVSDGAVLEINGATNESALWVGDNSSNSLLVDGGTVTVSNTYGLALGVWNGNGTLTLTNNGLVINQDSSGEGFQVGGVNAGPGSGTVNLNGGGTLQVNRLWGRAGTGTFNFNGGTLKPTGTFLGANFWLVENTFTANVQGGGAVIDSDSHAITIGSPLVDGGGNGGLTKKGSGVLTLAGANTYMGDTTIEAGTLSLSHTAPVLAATSTLSVSNTADINLAIAGVTNQVASFITNGVAAAEGVYGAGNSFGFVTGLGYLKVAAVAPPEPAYLTNSVSGNTLTLSWPAGQGWTLEAQTNSLSAGLQPTGWAPVSGAADGGYTNTIDKNNPTVFYRLLSE